MNHKNIILSSLATMLSFVTLFPNKCYVDFRVEYIMRYATITRFYGEYHADFSEYTKIKFVSFDTENCDPLPISTLGDVRWFYSSAVEGKFSHSGQAFEIIDPTITHVFAVRGETPHGWSHIYFGYNANKPKFKTSEGSIKVYRGKLLYVYSKNIHHPGHMQSEIVDGIRSIKELEGTPAYSNECYWTKQENKLKGTRYRDKK